MLNGDAIVLVVCVAVTASWAVVGIVGLNLYRHFK
jgi:hypothetical protein